MTNKENPYRAVQPLFAGSEQTQCDEMLVTVTWIKMANFSTSSHCTKTVKTSWMRLQASSPTYPITSRTHLFITTVNLPFITYNNVIDMLWSDCWGAFMSAIFISSLWLVAACSRGRITGLGEICLFKSKSDGIPFFFFKNHFLNQWKQYIMYNLQASPIPLSTLVVVTDKTQAEPISRPLPTFASMDFAFVIMAKGSITNKTKLSTVLHNWLQNCGSIFWTTLQRSRWQEEKKKQLQ